MVLHGDVGVDVDPQVPDSLDRQNRRVADTKWLSRDEVPAPREEHQSISVVARFNSNRFDFNHLDASLTQTGRLWQKMSVVVGFQES